MLFILGSYDAQRIGFFGFGSMLECNERLLHFGRTHTVKSDCLCWIKRTRRQGLASEGETLQAR